MAEQQTIDQLVGLAVAMLGVAPGTDWLNARAKQIDAGATVDDIANEIQSSTGFEARYPAFRSNERFAKDFLEALLGDNVTDAIMMAAQDHVTGRLKAGETRGEVAAFLVEAMTVIAADEENPFYADFGKAATAFHNKVMVAKHYTEEALKASPDDKVLEGVTDDPTTVETAINNIDNPQVEQPSMEGVTKSLTGVRDNLEGTDFDDTFIAEAALNPVTGASVAPLQSSDAIDGGDGVDTLEVYSSGRLSIQTRQIKNIERVVLDSDTSIDADMSSWEGLESVNVTHFDGDVTIEVDGASVSVKDGLTFNGEATIVGADGAVDINAGEESVVHVGSGDHTETVMVKGGASVKVDSGATGDKQQSKTVTKVVVDGVEQGAATGGAEAKPAVPNTDDVREVDIPANNQGVTPSLTAAQYVREATAEEITANGGPIDDSNSRTPTGAMNVLAITASEAARNTYYIADLDEKSEGVELGNNDGVILVTTDEKKAAGYTETPAVDAVGGTVKPTVTVNSDAIETVQLHNTNAIAVVRDDSKKKDDDDKDIPDRAPLAVAVDDFDGELRLEGGAVSDDVTFNVVKASNFDLVASTKMVTVEGDAKLTLDVHGSAGKPSTTLETIKVSGKGGVTMAGLSGMDGLKTIDASDSSGANHFRSQADEDGPTDEDQLKALTMVKGGSGKDTVTLRTSPKGKLEHIDTGDGGDMVTITGAHRAEGLKVELGAGDDTFVGDSGGNEKSLIDGGADRDTLKLSAEPATYKDGDDTKSIFSNFEVLDVGGAVDSTFDVELLGIGTGDVLATGGTAGDVMLKNMAVGMGITVKAEEKGEDASADITHEFVDGLRRDQDLKVNLEAMGDDDDTDSAAGTTGEVTLMLDVHSRVDTLNVNSSASVGGSKTEAPAMAPKAADYSNTLTLDGTQDDVRDIVVTGDASLTIDGTALGAVRLVDASESGGGVTFTATGSGAIEFSGGAGKDILDAGTRGTYEINGGAGADMLIASNNGGEMTGGAGADELTAGAGVDMFIIEDVSDSQLSFNARTDDIEGVDIIDGFTGGSDKIVLPESLFDSLRGTIQTVSRSSGTTLKDYVDDDDTKDGFFERPPSPAVGLNPPPDRHSLVLVTLGTEAWLFIDADDNGNLDLAEDHVIQLSGVTSLTVDNTPTSDIISSG